MKRIAPGFYQVQHGITYTYIVKVGRLWRVTAFWMCDYGAEHKTALAVLARGSKFAYPTLAMAISAAEGNRAS